MQTRTDLDNSDVNVIADLTPFKGDDLAGQKFARGNMLGGAQPLESADQAPWEKENNLA